MGIVNRRNAVLGWAAWQMGKKIAKKRAKGAVPGLAEGTKTPRTAAIVSIVAALAGMLWLWRRRGGNGDEGGFRPESDA